MAEAEVEVESRRVYHVSCVDGSEMVVELAEGATVRDATMAVAAQRGVPSYQVKLVVAGQSTPLARPLDKLLEASQGQQELLMIASKHHVLGEGRPLATSVTDVTFEHLPVDCFLGPMKGEVEVEMVEGKEMAITAMASDKRDGPRGVLFDQLDSQAAPPLSGRVLLRIVQQKRQYAMGIGVGTARVDVQKDPEHDPHFFGLYHGGASVNVCAHAKRVYVGDGIRWPDESGKGVWLAILIDVEAHTMQCFAGHRPFGPVVELPSEPLWPVFVAFRESDCFRMSMRSV